MHKLLPIVTLLFFTSCTRQAYKSKTTATVKKDSSYKVIDTSKQQDVTRQVQVIDFGDSLTGYIYFPDDVKRGWVDSLESSGIKIKTMLIPASGGFKVQINAIAKPKQVVNTTVTTQTKQAGITTTTNVKLQETHTTADKQIKSSRIPFWVYPITLLFLLTVIFFIIKKFKRSWLKTL